MPSEQNEYFVFVVYDFLIQIKQLHHEMRSAPLGKYNTQRSMREMTRKDIKINIRKKLWEKAVKKAKSEFQFIHTATDALNTILLLSLYKARSKHRRTDNIFLAYSDITEMVSDTYISFTIETIGELLDESKKNTT